MKKNSDPKRLNFLHHFLGIKTLIILVCIIIIIGLLEATLLLSNGPNIQQQAANAEFSGIHVVGNKIYNQQRQLVILHGVDRSGTEYQCVHNAGIFDGPSDQSSIEAMASWGINAVRIPLNEDCWLGINGANPSGSVYQQAIINYVNLLNQNNIYAIVDLHWSAPGNELSQGQQVMADKDHSLDFWQSVALAFKNNNTVIFDLYNEPYDISWSCWKNGTDCNTAFPVASMQDMINTVRGTGATNILMLGGLSYANDLSGWLDNKPSDPLNNLAASFHMYGDKYCNSISCWNSTLAPISAQVPLIAGEFGESSSATACTDTISASFLNWMDMHDSSYLGWVWNAWGNDCGNLSLITNYNGTPHDPNGTFYKAHLLGLLGDTSQSPTSLPVKKDILIPNQNVNNSNATISNKEEPSNPTPTIYCVVNCTSPTRSP